MVEGGLLYATAESAAYRELRLYAVILCLCALPPGFAWPGEGMVIARALLWTSYTRLGIFHVTFHEPYRHTMGSSHIGDGWKGFLLPLDLVSFSPSLHIGRALPLQPTFTECQSVAMYLVSPSGRI